MLRETCHECERLRRKFDEGVQKSFQIEERLRNARNCQDHALAKALAVQLAPLAEARVRFYRLLMEHEAQGHPSAS